mgnify:CR=1 FL=1
MKFIIKSTLFAIAFFYLLSVVTTNRSRRTKTATKTKNPNLFQIYSNWANAGNGDVASLSALNVQCGSGSALASFHLDRSVENIRYEAKCIAQEGISSKVSEHSTPANVHNGSGGSTNFLDRHHLICPEGSLIQQFQLQKEGNKIKYNYKCVEALIDGKCYKKYTSWTEGGKNYNNYYLDRQTASVGNLNHQAIGGFRLLTEYPSFSFFRTNKVNYRYEILVCNLKPAPGKPVLNFAGDELDSLERNKDTKRKYRRH